MAIKQLKTVAVGTTSVILIQLLSSFSIPGDRTFIYPSTNFNFSPALAAPPKPKPKFRYVPPRRRPPKNTQATVSRGCVQSSQSQPITLTLLAPQDHDGTTISGHPNFFWHVSTPVPMVFTLTQLGTVQPLLEQQIQPQQAGIIQLKMPRGLPELVPGQEYRWSVTMMCNPDRPSANPFIQAWIKRVPVTPALNQQLTTTTTERDRASIYAQSGLWYDALEAISVAHQANFQDKSILEERILLLEQVGLTEIAAQERQRLDRAAVQ